MTKAEKRKILIRYRDLFKGKKAEEDNNELYLKFYNDLEASECIDYDYSDHMNHGEYDDAISHAGDFSFQECCAYLTFVLRGERWAGGWFAKCIDDGTIHQLLSRMLEVM